jgi:hypothetical protein
MKTPKCALHGSWREKKGEGEEMGDGTGNSR